MLSEEEVKELLLLPLTMYGADEEVFLQHNWGHPDDEFIGE